ncbi:hypothetical protein [Sphingomonas sanxanigenens]|uniref:Uncharacterized protein n=1 Tax=Sphingomonas sanxanigenens DSM 19645 = NX02 TaxID=1123269 RepID=W0AC98_9SPHN|nr:hypothetical protein [Sphingomonas sanxanigenens]AHE55504.1 hypothetical protein NX02_19200 [Sphingomonas sanxanigenens DSM 19645 = NX02]
MTQIVNVDIVEFGAPAEPLPRALHIGQILSFDIANDDIRFV